MTSFNKPIPEGLDINTEIGVTVIARKWYSWSTWILLLFTIFWDSFLFIWYAAAFSSTKPFQLVVVLFPLLHVGAGLYLTYFVVCSFLNTTRFYFEESRLKIATTPIPWPGDKIIDRMDLNGFIAREIQNRKSRSYKVIYVNRENREKSLSPGFSDPAQVEYIVDYLTFFYKTPDLPGFKKHC